MQLPSSEMKTSAVVCGRLQALRPVRIRDFIPPFGIIVFLFF
jgi:hypothetical protein